MFILYSQYIFFDKMVYSNTYKNNILSNNNILTYSISFNKPSAKLAGRITIGWFFDCDLHKFSAFIFTYNPRKTYWVYKTREITDSLHELIKRSNYFLYPNRIYAQ